MLLEIMPVYDPKKTCTQDLIVSVSSFWGRDYELMYTSAWGLELPGWYLYEYILDSMG